MSINKEALTTIAPPSLAEHDSEVKFQLVSQNKLAWLDLKASASKWRIWFMLAYQDIKLRYRRSVLGPFWLTLSMAITLYSMGFLYSRLFHIELQRYFPFLVSGMLSWSLISNAIVELTDGFTSYDTLVKQIKMPYTLYIHRIVARNVIIFFHNILVIVPIIAIYHEYAKVNVNSLLLIPGLLIIYFNAITYGTVLAMIGARYRDISQVIKSLIQVIFFVTPIMWAPDVLIGRREFYFIDFNPFYAFLEIIRQPLMGRIPTFTNLIVVAIVTLIGMLISFKMFARYRARIVYWL